MSQINLKQQYLTLRKQGKSKSMCAKILNLTIGTLHKRIEDWGFEDSEDEREAINAMPDMVLEYPCFEEHEFDWVTPSVLKSAVYILKRGIRITGDIADYLSPDDRVSLGFNPTAIAIQKLPENTANGFIVTEDKIASGVLIGGTPVVKLVTERGFKTNTRLKPQWYADAKTVVASREMKK